MPDLKQRFSLPLRPRPVPPAFRVAEKTLRICLAGRIEDFFRRPRLHDPPLLHHIYPAAQRRGHSHVMAHQQQGSARLPDDPLKKEDDLRLDCGVEGSRRLIRYDQLRLTGQRGCDDHPLAHSSGKLEGILLHPQSRILDPHKIQELLSPLPRRLPAAASPDPDRLCDLPPDLHRRVQTALGILENDRRILSRNRSLPAEREPVAADIRFFPEKAHDREHGRALAGAGLSDDAHDLPLAHRKADVPERLLDDMPAAAGLICSLRMILDI